MPLCSAAALITFHQSYDASLLRFLQRLVLFDRYKKSWRFTACAALKNEGETQLVSLTFTKKHLLSFVFYSFLVGGGVLH